MTFSDLLHDVKFKFLYCKNIIEHVAYSEHVKNYAKNKKRNFYQYEMLKRYWAKQKIWMVDNKGEVPELNFITKAPLPFMIFHLHAFWILPFFF